MDNKEKYKVCWWELLENETLLMPISLMPWNILLTEKNVRINQAYTTK